MASWTDAKGQKHHDMGTCHCGAHHALEGQQKQTDELKSLRAQVAALTQERDDRMRGQFRLQDERDLAVARAEAAEAALADMRRALEGVAWKDSAGLCWCPGETEFAVANPGGEHTPRCLQARRALAAAGPAPEETPNEWREIAEAFLDAWWEWEPGDDTEALDKAASQAMSLRGDVIKLAGPAPEETT